MKKIIVSVGALVLALALAGCGISASVSDTPAKDKVTTSPKAATEPVEASSATPVPAETMIFAFGETIEYDDGLGMSVSAPAGFTPTEWASRGDEPNSILFNVKITNNTSEPYSPAVWGTLASGGAEATEIFDVDNGLEGGPMTPVLPGQTVEWKVGFSVLDPADLTYALAPGYEYNQAIFTTVAP